MISIRLPIVFRGSFRPHILSLPATSHVQVREKNYRPKPKPSLLTWPNDWLPFEWEIPQKEIGYFATGDPDEKFREASKDVIEGEFRRGYEFLKDREDVPESVKTLFRLKNSRRMEITSFIRRKRNQEFMRHPLDKKSHEVLIANYTSKIRHLQEFIRYDNPYMSITRIMCNLFKNKRNKLLNELSRMDENRYRAVVAKLGLKHQPSQAGVIDDLPVVRNDSLRQLTREYCDNIRRERLTAYHDKLKALQEPFLEEKKRTLEWIRKEMEKYHINEEDVSTEFRIRDKYRDLPVKRTPVAV